MTNYSRSFYKHHFWKACVDCHLISAHMKTKGLFHLCGTMPQVHMRILTLGEDVNSCNCCHRDHLPLARVHRADPNKRSTFISFPYWLVISLPIWLLTAELLSSEYHRLRLPAVTHWPWWLLIASPCHSNKSSYQYHPNYLCHAFSRIWNSISCAHFYLERKQPFCDGDVKPPDYLCNSALSASQGQYCV